MTLPSLKSGASATRPARGACALLLITLAGALAGCGRSHPPETEALAAAMQTYLARRGQLCLAKSAWPIDVTQHEVDVGARNARQMPVLERLGLVTSSVAGIDVDDEGTPHHMLVRRYALTDEGRKYYLPRERTASAPQQPAADFCAATLRLDRIVDWQVQGGTAGAPAQAVVTYTYQVEAAPWTADAEAQQVFPMVAGVVRGAGTAQLKETFSRTDAGWVAVDLLGS